MGWGDLRSSFYPELSNPNIRNGLFALTNAEVGSQGPLAQQAFMESVFNRASARGQSLADTIYDRNYFPKTTFDRMGGKLPEQTSGVYGSLLNDVMGGSNVAAYGTGNASGTVGFAGGPQTAAYGGERYGIEGKDRDWARRAAQLPNEGLNEVGPNGLQPLHPEIYASTAQSSPSPSAPVTTGSLPGQRPMDTPSLATPPPGLLSRLGIEKPGFVSDLQTGLNSPLAQQGIGLLLAGLTGRDPNAGMSAGAQRANMATMDLIHRMEADRARKLFPLQVEQARAGLAQTNAALERGRQMLPLDVEQAKNAIAKQNLDIAQAKSTFTHIGTDAMGLPIYGFVDPITKQVTPAQIPGQSGGVGPHSGLTGEEFLKTLDPSLAAEIKGYAEGRIPYSPTMAKSPRGMALTRFITQYDPNFDAVNYAARNAVRKDFTSGKSAQNVSSFNTAIAHLDTLDKTIAGLNNVSALPILNGPINAVAGAVSADFQRRRNNFEMAKTAVVDELTRAFRGTGGNVHDLIEWNKSLNSASSPEALHAAVRQGIELLRGRIHSLGDTYNRGMGTTKDPLELLSPKAQAALRRMDGGHGAETEKAAATGVKPPVPGEVQDGYRFKGGNPADKNSWEPVSVPKFVPQGMTR